MKPKRFLRRKSDRISWIRRILVILAIIPILSISLGMNSMIDTHSPYILSSFYGLMDGFFTNMVGHLSILIGAFLLTLIIWDVTHDDWEK